MANKFTRYLSAFGKGLFQGATNPKGDVGNWRHATRLFVDNTYALAPRHQFSFYVHVKLNQSVVKAPQFSAKHGREIGLLVKRTDLPKYSFEMVTKNQYNRKKQVYKDFKYDPVNFTFHDDNTGVINALWALYQGYYVRDRLNPKEAYGATHYLKKDSPLSNFRYGLDNDISAPFIDEISIYTMSRRRFNGYTLINPRILNWSHGQVDYSVSDFIEHSMQIGYEAVIYSSGSVTVGNPTGFAELHYDNTPSPLSVAGGGTSTLAGPGGVLDGIESVFGVVGSGNLFESPQTFLGTAIQAVNTYKNARNLTKEGLLQEGINILTSPGAANSIANTISGAVGTIWPRNSTSGTGNIIASAKRLLGR